LGAALAAVAVLTVIEVAESSGAGPELVALGETVADMVAEERDTLTPESFITMAANKDNIAGS
jgi:hypothetical protein